MEKSQMILPLDIEEYYEPLRLKEPTAEDASLHPSYTNLVVTYDVVCRQRYWKAGQIHRKQFIREIRIQEALQQRALDGVRIHREFSNPVIKPPNPSTLIKLTNAEQFKLDKILDRKTEIK